MVAVRLCLCLLGHYLTLIRRGQYMTRAAFFSLSLRWQKKTRLALNRTCDSSAKPKKKGKTARWSVTGISILYTIMVRAAYLMKISLFLRYISSHHAQLSVST